MIRAGTVDEINTDSGSWIYLDIGFSNSKSTCGLAFDNSEPECVEFAEANNRIANHISRLVTPCNLMIEAPLSVAFNKKCNPMGRKFEKVGSLTRYWYVGLGCALTTAALYLLKHLVDTVPEKDIRLFEGFVTFKDKTKKSDHVADVRLLREVVVSPSSIGYSIYEAEELKAADDCKLMNAFEVAGISNGIPPMIAMTAYQQQ